MDAIQPFDRRISEVTKREFRGSGSRFHNGDTLLARITPCLENGKTAYVDSLADREVAHGSTEFIVLSGIDGVSDNLFVYYMARHPIFRDFAIKRMEGTSGRQRVPAPALSKFKLNLPPLSEQRAIAHILGTLDDKIELNRKMNETLEAMARAIFQSWFVDFDPVKAKAEGRQPVGMDADTAALFPDSFQNSPLGPIPKGWETAYLGKVTDNPRRGVSPDQIEPDTPYIALQHMPKRCIALAEWGTADDLQSNKFEFRKGEILFGKLRPYFHKVGVAPLDGLCSTDIVVVTPRTEKWFGFVLAHVSSTAFVEYTNVGSTGTKMPRTSWGEMARYAVALPPETVAEAFTKQIRPTVGHIIASIHESRTLAEMRDTLLPKLLSGEVRVDKAETIASGSK